MSKSIINQFPEPPEGCKWWITVLDSNSGEIGAKLARTKPYIEYGATKIMEKWTPNKTSKHVQHLIDAATGTTTKLF